MKDESIQVVLSRKSVVFLTPPICWVSPPKEEDNPPPFGFVCSSLKAALTTGAKLTQQTSEEAVPKGVFQPFVYHGHQAERNFRAGYPTCSRLLIENPSNAVDVAGLEMVDTSGLG